jgi:hypothetical protein
MEEKIYPYGAFFTYKSKYGGFMNGIVEKKLLNGRIKSTKGVVYYETEVELESLEDFRERKLKEIGI